MFNITQGIRVLVAPELNFPNSSVSFIYSQKYFYIIFINFLVRNLQEKESVFQDSKIFEDQTTEAHCWRDRAQVQSSSFSEFTAAGESPCWALFVHGLQIVGACSSIRDNQSFHFMDSETFPGSWNDFIEVAKQVNIKPENPTYWSSSKSISFPS